MTQNPLVEEEIFVFWRKGKIVGTLRAILFFFGGGGKKKNMNI